MNMIANEIEYILQKPSKKIKETNNFLMDEESIIIFCVDISGSMSQTTTIPNGHSLLKIKVIENFNFLIKKIY